MIITGSELYAFLYITPFATHGHGAEIAVPVPTNIHHLSAVRRTNRRTLRSASRRGMVREGFTSDLP